MSPRYRPRLKMLDENVHMKKSAHVWTCVFARNPHFHDVFTNTHRSAKQASDFQTTKSARWWHLIEGNAAKLSLLCFRVLTDQIPLKCDQLFSSMMDNVAFILFSPDIFLHFFKQTLFQPTNRKQMAKIWAQTDLDACWASFVFLFFFLSPYKSNCLLSNRLHEPKNSSRVLNLNSTGCFASVTMQQYAPVESRSKSSGLTTTWRMPA